MASCILDPIPHLRPGALPSPQRPQWFMIYGAHKGKVTSCSWSADARKFVTAGTDSVMGIWDAESGAPLFKFNVKAGPLTTCAVSPQVRPAALRLYVSCVYISCV